MIRCSAGLTKSHLLVQHALSESLVNQLPQPLRLKNGSSQSRDDPLNDVDQSQPVDYEGEKKDQKLHRRWPESACFLWLENSQSFELNIKREKWMFMFRRAHQDDHREGRVEFLSQ